MRIVAGTLGGRLFDAPGTFTTHPMSEKARGALFNVLGDIGGLTVFDPFGGSGAIGFEAASRGAGQVLITENDRAAQKIIESNIRSLELTGQVHLAAASVNAWLETNSDMTFDLILCDPPYNDPQPNLIMRLADRVKAYGILVLSWPPDVDLPTLNLELLKRKQYGDASLAFYRRTKDN